jgi:hypothetical protein
MNPWLATKKKVDAVIVQQLTQGLSAERIALTIAVGLCIAIIRSSARRRSRASRPPGRSR